MLLFGVAMPLIFFVCGGWFVYLAVRSWHGRAPRPSGNYLLAVGSPRVVRFLDRCILPLGLLYVSLGAMLGLGNAMAHFGLSGSALVHVLFGVAALASVTFLVLTCCVYRYWRPRRLMPAYARLQPSKGHSKAALSPVDPGSSRGR